MPLSLSRSFLVVLALSALHCSQSSSLEPTFEGCATDENWQTLTDYESTNRVKIDANAGPKWVQPAASPTGPDFPSTMPATLRWQPAASNPGSDEGNVTCAAHDHPASLHYVGGTLRPLHEAPISGVVYDLQFSVGDSVAYRVVTTRQYTTVPQSFWGSWAGQRVSVDLVSATLLKNDVAEGPYRPAAMLSFQVKQ